MNPKLWRYEMTKAEQFSKNMQDVLERQRTVQDDLTKITGSRPTHQFAGILFSVTNDGNMEINTSIIADSPPYRYDPEIPLKFAKWIQDNFS